MAASWVFTAPPTADAADVATRARMGRVLERLGVPGFSRQHLRRVLVHSGAATALQAHLESFNDPAQASGWLRALYSCLAHCHLHPGSIGADQGAAESFWSALQECAPIFRTVQEQASWDGIGQLVEYFDLSADCSYAYFDWGVYRLFIWPPYR